MYKKLLETQDEKLVFVLLKYMNVYSKMIYKHEVINTYEDEDLKVFINKYSRISLEDFLRTNFKIISPGHIDKIEYEGNVVFSHLDSLDFEMAVYYPEHIFTPSEVVEKYYNMVKDLKYFDISKINIEKEINDVFDKIVC